jgi:hypothetical protein
MKDKFNIYCAEVMGYELVTIGKQGNDFWILKGKTMDRIYNPYDDLNQMAEVVEKLMDDPLVAYDVFHIQR